MIVSCARPPTFFRGSGTASSILLASATASASRAATAYRIGPSHGGSPTVARGKG